MKQFSYWRRKVLQGAKPVTRFINIASKEASSNRGSNAQVPQADDFALIIESCGLQSSGQRDRADAGGIALHATATAERATLTIFTKRARSWKTKPSSTS